MLDLSPTLVPHYCFWWKDEEGKVQHTYGSKEKPHPGDWVDSRKEAERTHHHWVENKVIHDDTEWGIAEQEIPVYRVAANNDEVVVLIDEEYGFRFWLWKTGMTAEALVKWWMGMDTVRPHFMDPCKSLPGELCGVHPTGVDRYVVPGPEGSFRYVEESSLWWDAHLHMEDDSFLMTPKGREVRHRGFGEGV